jgi:putative membrane protein
MTGRDGPVLIELEDAPESPAEAAPVPDALADDGPTGQAMRTVAALTARQQSRLARWFWRLLTAIVAFAASVAAWDFVEGLVTRNAILGWVAIVLLGAFAAVAIAIAIKEIAALSRLSRLDDLHRDAEAARSTNDLAAARKVADRLLALYQGRDELKWGRDRFAERRGDVFDADALFDLGEAELLAPLDAAARIEVESSARQVAAVTAIVPLAFADVIAALASNLRMIRRIAEIYGGRGGTVETWRLTRAVMTHLVATGFVAVGDDLIGSIGGGHVLSRISRRFGEGIVNGALTARVGIAAMEVCRPLPFHGQQRPRVTSLLQRALTGLYPKSLSGRGEPAP